MKERNDNLNFEYMKNAFYDWLRFIITWLKSNLIKAKKKKLKSC